MAQIITGSRWSSPRPLTYRLLNGNDILLDPYTSVAEADLGVIESPVEGQMAIDSLGISWQYLSGRWGAFIFDPYTKLLLHGFSYNGSTTIIDSSPYPKSLSIVGNTNISTTTSKFADKSSIYFDGSGDYLNAENFASWNFSTNNFCLEFWLRSSASITNSKYICYLENTAGTEYISISLNNRYDVGGPDYGIIVGVNASWMGYGANGSLTDTNWHHFALVRNGNTILMYIDGNLGNSLAFSNPINLLGTKKYFGGYGPDLPQYSIDGYMSDIKLSVGTARYTDEFTLPIIPHSDLSTGNDGYTSLLIHGTGSDGSILIQDYSPQTKSVSIVGNTNISTAQSKLGNGSICFDGSGDSITVADNVDFSLGSLDFTIDCWVYLTTLDQNQVFWSSVYTDGAFSFSFNHATSGKQGLNIGCWSTGWVLVFYIYQGNKTGWTVNSWNHVAVVRSGNIITLYLNGVAVANGSCSSAIPAYNQHSIGSVISEQYLNGYMQEFRFSKGIARWVDNFTPNSLPYKGGEWDGVDEYTKLLLRFDGVNGQNTTVDSSQYNHTISMYNGANLTTTVKYFGTTALLLDGSDDYLSTPQSSDFNFAGDFTIEFFVSFNNPASLGYLIGNGNLQLGTDGWSIGRNSGGFIWISYTGVSISCNADGWTAGIWHHVALVRSGSSIKVYRDGVQDTSQYATATDSSNWVSSNPLQIGKAPAGNSYMFSGYLDEVRILNGYAKYTQNFSVPYKQVGV